MSIIAEAPIKTTWASDAGHWYDISTSEPRYTIIGANGKERDTTLRDARKYGWAPSVTGIIKVAAAPGLENWIRNGLLDAAWKQLAYNVAGDKEEWQRQVKELAGEISAKAKDEGTAIHGAIERSFKEKWPAIAAEYDEHVLGAGKCLTDAFGVVPWVAEKSFASATYGYGCKIDLSYFTSVTNEGQVGLVVDIKTKDFDKATPTKDMAWDEQVMQLAANREAAKMPLALCANLFVSRTVPGLAKLHVWNEDEVRRGWTMFLNLLRFWQAKNRYDPSAP